MQRAALCLVAVLVLLAGCSGGTGGGSDATPTAASTATETLDSHSNETESGESGPASTLRILDAGTAESTVLEGEQVAVNTTVKNVGNETTHQTISLAGGNLTVGDQSVRVAPGDTRQVSLASLNTSSLEPGRQLFGVSTDTDSTAFSLEVRPREPLREFISNVRGRTIVLNDSRIIDENHVELTFESDDNHINDYREGEADPVPQATAFEMASDPDAPERVTLTLPSGMDEPRWQSTLTESLATGYANESLSPAEFRSELAENATGFETDFEPRLLVEQFTYATGDRARRAYVEELAQRLNNSTHGNLTVTDYGLFNDTIRLPDSTRTLGPNMSIYVEFEVPTDEEQMDYRGFSSTDGGVRIFETIFKWGNLSKAEKHGQIPDSVRLQFRNSEGQVHQTWDIPTSWSQQGAIAGVDGVLAVYKKVTFSSLSENYGITEN